MATIRQRGKTYQIRASAGYDTAGKQIIKAMTWAPEKEYTPRQLEKELNRISFEFESRVSTGQFIDPSIRFSEYAELWMKRRAEGGSDPCAPRTYENYKHLLSRIIPAIGHIKLSELQPHHIREFLDNLREGGIRSDARYKPIVDLSAILKERKIKKAGFARQINIGLTALCAACNGKPVSKQAADGICKGLSIKLKSTFVMKVEDKLSETTILHHYRMISTVLSGAVIDDNILLYNPAQRVRPPRKERPEALYLDEVQAAQMLEYLDVEPMQYKTAIRLLLFTGLRRGELLGLNWDDISFKDSVLSIRRSSQYIPSKGIYEKSTKNESSSRAIKLPAIVVNTLREHKSWQTEQRLLIADLWQDSGRLFTQWNGNPMHPDTLSGWFHEFISKHPDLPQIHLHSLRHTNATLLIAGGQNIQTVSRRLGHSQTSTTSDIYAHAIQSADAKAAEVLEDILNPLGKKH